MKLYLILFLSLLYSDYRLIALSTDLFNTNHTQPDMRKYGKMGEAAPELMVGKWIDKDGLPREEILLSNYEDKVVVLYCFQAWCPGCHSSGLPTLKKLVNHFQGNNAVSFLAIQTVFEGSHANTYERMLEIQKEYKLSIPFGHDDGSNVDQKVATTMTNYKTGGTPWFIIINKENEVVFNNFRIDSPSAVEMIDTLINE